MNFRYIYLFAFFCLFLGATLKVDTVLMRVQMLLRHNQVVIETVNGRTLIKLESLK